MAETEQKIIDRCEATGESAVRSGLVAGDWGDSPSHPVRRIVETWLAAKDNAAASASAARRDAREEETLSSAKEANSIARSALHNSKMANIWAAIAALIATIAMYIAYVAITKP